MIAGTSWLLALMLGTMPSAATLPLRPGTYVQTGSPCHDPALAAVFNYDGRRFRYPHATDCRSVIQSHVGRTYYVTESCSALGDGSAAVADTTQATYTVLSNSRVRIGRGPADTTSSFRWCAGPRARKGS